jgi:hypothetical protein
VAECRKLSTLLVDASLDTANPQTLGEIEGIALVALRSAAFANTNDDGFLYVGRKHLEEPSGMSALLEDQSSTLGDGLKEFDQGSGVGFQNLTLKLSATGAEDSDGAA